MIGICFSYIKWVYHRERVNLYKGIERFDEGTSSDHFHEGTSSDPFHEGTSSDPFHIEGTSSNPFSKDNELLGMLHDLQALVKHEEETMEEGLENDMSFNSAVEKGAVNIFQNLLNQTHHELYLECSEFSSLSFWVTLHVKVLND
ncbi:GDSL esterase/lipase [Cucumis melo var. makuwa]|uniref:GDSL esterase/lipase n=1 Tax=Cucumis melo var. makuwa TaxID=1194695 RepID=A0A5A7TDJ1_CUCMM|nr:GDSL esterase/lipase [Cucumis melo var. makuwa]